MSSLKSSVQRYLGLIICILLIITLATPPITVAGAASGRELDLQAPTSTDISPLVGGIKVCNKSKNPLTFLVSFMKGNISIDVAGVTVSIHSDTGNQTIKSSSAGTATFTYTAKTEGKHTISATATKDGYTSDSTTFDVTVVKCEWKLGFDFSEEYMLFSDKTIVVGANATYEATFTVDDDGNLVPAGDPTIRQYHFFAEDLLKPLNVSFDKQGSSGNISIHVKGTVNETGVRLQLSSDPIDLPNTVSMRFTDVKGAYIILPLAPVATTGQVNLIDEAGWSSLSFPPGGGSTIFHHGPRFFIDVGSVIFSAGAIKFDKIKP
jgi:hypothetical protein